MKKHGRIDVLTCAPEDQDKLFDILQHIAKHTESEDDCIFFIISKDDDKPEKIWVTELWTSKKAHDDALTNAPAELIDLINQGMALVTDERQRAFLTPVVGKGMPLEK